MGFYRQKPVVIEAFKLGVDPIPDWFIEKVKDQEIILETSMCAKPYENCYCEIHTSKGIMEAYAHKDYIIKGTKGEIYPCKIDIFEEIYEEVINHE